MQNIYKIGRNLFTVDSLEHVVAIVYHHNTTDYRFEKSGNNWNYFEDRHGKKQSSPDHVISSEILVDYLNRMLTNNSLSTTRDIVVTCEDNYDYDLIEKKSNWIDVAKLYYAAMQSYKAKRNGKLQ